MQSPKKLDVLKTTTFEFLISVDFIHSAIVSYIMQNPYKELLKEKVPLLTTLSNENFFNLIKCGEVLSEEYKV